MVGGGEGAEHQDQQGHGPGGGDEREDVDGLRGWSGYDSTAERDAVKWYEERAGAPGRTLRTSSSFRSRSEENKGKENDMRKQEALKGTRLCEAYLDLRSPGYCYRPNCFLRTP